MALNFTVSYTFSPSTTISSSQVNTNTSDVAAVFQGLEAETKTLAKLKVDIDPTLALEVATKQYVDHYSTYRRPNLQFNNSTVVNVEAGIDGTSGEVRILFPDGTIRTDSTTGRVQCNVAQVAALSGTWQSGLRTGSVANNTWYAIYMVKTTDDSAKMVAVADTVLPIQANFATLNSNFGTNGWVYLGLVRHGDQGGAATGILAFFQNGNFTFFENNNTGGNVQTPIPGIRMATTAAATTLGYANVAGTAGAVIPNNINLVLWRVGTANTNTGLKIQSADGSGHYLLQLPAILGGGNCMATVLGSGDSALKPGVFLTGTNGAMDIFLAGFYDSVLGVGANPIL